MSNQDKPLLSFAEISKEIYKVYGQQSVLPIIFGVASIYREHIVNVNGCFPVLFLKGTFATGKTSLSSVLQSVFSDSKVLVLPSMKSAGILSSIPKKGIVAFDEYNSENRSDAWIKAAYSDTKFYIGTKKGNINQGHFSTVIVASHHLPIDITVLNRTILVNNERAKYSNKEVENFKELADLMANSNCNCISEFKRHDSFVFNNFEFLYKRCEKDLLPFSDSKNLRIISNYATIIAIYDCLKGLVDFPFNLEELYQTLDSTISYHDSIN